MKKYEYKVLEFDTNNEEIIAFQMEADIASLGEVGYELKNITVVGETIYVFLMREKP